MPGPSYWPLWTAASTFLVFFGFLIQNAITLAIGIVAVVVSLLGWHSGHISGEEH